MLLWCLNALVSTGVANNRSTTGVANNLSSTGIANNVNNGWLSDLYWNEVNSGVTSFPALTFDFRGKRNAACHLIRELSHTEFTREEIKGDRAINYKRRREIQRKVEREEWEESKGE